MSRRPAGRAVSAPPTTQLEVSLDFAANAVSKAVVLLDAGNRGGTKVAMQSAHVTMASFGLIVGAAAGLYLGWPAGLAAAGTACGLGAAACCLAGSLIYRVTFGRRIEAARIENQIFSERMKLLDDLIKGTRDPVEKKKLLESRTKQALLLASPSPATLLLTDDRAHQVAIAAPRPDPT